jgi:pimeloyl-ACP methyl ester carboxylesterase
MPLAAANGIDIWYETFGDPDDPPLLLVMGLGAQAIAWPDELCQGFVDRGFFVIRFDNRDVGLSGRATATPDLPALMSAAASGNRVEAPYLLADMAEDALAVFEALGVGAAHLVGASMGGMIAQTLAIAHPERVLTLTSIMSTTGQPDVGQADPAVLPVLLEPPAQDRDGVLEQAVRRMTAIGSPDHVDEERVREAVGAAYDRAFDSAGVARQLAAILASGSRADGLARLTVPTLVIHGTVDRLVNPSGGQRTVELVPGAQLELIEGMGHDLPVVFWSRIIELVTRHAAQAASTF